MMKTKMKPGEKIKKSFPKGEYKGAFRRGTAMFAVMLAAALVGAVCVWAASFHVSVTGGSEIETIATADDDYVGSLTDIHNPDYNKSQTTFSGTGWSEGTVVDVNSGAESTGVYKTVSGSSASENLQVRYPNYLRVGKRRYDVVLKLTSCVTDASKALFSVRKDLINVQMGTPVAESAVTNGEQYGSKEVGYEVRIYEAGTTTPAKIGNIHIGIIDLDKTDHENGASSTEVVKINGFSADQSNTWIRTEVKGRVRCAGGSFYGTGVSNNDANVFVRTEDLAKEGWYSGYYGWMLTSGSANARGGLVITFYATEFPVRYTTDGHGTVDPEEEQRFAGENPEGSEQIPDEGYSFTGWTVDRPVRLEDGTVIEAGGSITADQIRKVVVAGELTFTAHYEPVWKITTKAVNGTISEEEKNIPSGENRVVTYTPMEGYQLKTLTVDGEAKDVKEFPASWRFSGIDANHHVEAVFEKTPVLEVSKSADPPSCRAGATVSYRVNVRQTAEGAQARDVVIRDTLPEGLVMVRDSLKGEADFRIVSAGDGGYELELTELTGEMTFTYEAVCAKAMDGGELINVVSVSGSNVPGDPVRAEAKVSPFVLKPSIEKTVSNEHPKTGETVSYAISVKETGEGLVLENGDLTDPLPDGLEIEEDSLKLDGDPGEIVEAGPERIRVFIPELKEETVLTFRAKVTKTSGEVNNVAELTGDGADPVKDAAVITVAEADEPASVKTSPVSEETEDGVDAPSDPSASAKESPEEVTRAESTGAASSEKKAGAEVPPDSPAGSGKAAGGGEAKTGDQGKILLACILAMGALAALGGVLLPSVWRRMKRL